MVKFGLLGSMMNQGTLQSRKFILKRALVTDKSKMQDVSNAASSKTLGTIEGTPEKVYDSPNETIKPITIHSVQYKSRMGTFFSGRWFN